MDIFRDVKKNFVFGVCLNSGLNIIVMFRLGIEKVK